MEVPSRPPRASSDAHHVLVGPSRTTRAWLGTPPPSLPVHRDAPSRDARHTQGAKTHVAGRAPEHVRQEAGPRRRRSHELGPGSLGGPVAVSTRCRPLRSHHPAHTHTHTRGALNTHLPEPAPALPHHHVRGQTPRDLPLVARDFPQHGALERARDCAQALLPSAARARAPPKAGLAVRVGARGASHLCEFHHGGGL